jgi:hypothetical protein
MLASRLITSVVICGILPVSPVVSLSVGRYRPRGMQMLTIEGMRGRRLGGEEKGGKRRAGEDAKVCRKEEEVTARSYFGRRRFVMRGTRAQSTVRERANKDEAIGENQRLANQAAIIEDEERARCEGASAAVLHTEGREG